MTLKQKGLIVVAILVLVQVVIFGTLYWVHIDLCKAAERAQLSVDIARYSNRALGDVLLLTSQSFTSQNITSPDIQKLIDYQREDFRLLQNVLKSEPKRLKQARLGLHSAEEALAILENGRKQILNGHIDVNDVIWRPLKEKSQGAIADVSANFNFLEDEEKNINRILARQKEQQLFNERLLIAGLVVEVVFSVIFLGWFELNVSKRMKMLIENSQRLARREPLSNELVGSDEIANLDEMLHRVDAALSIVEANEESMIENARDIICQVDEELRIKEMNSASREMIAYAPNDLVGKSLIYMVPSAFRQKLEELFTESKTRESIQFESVLSSRHGRQVDVNYSVSWSPHDNSYFCVVHDISVLKNVERLRREVVQMVSHDLRNPLLTVSSFLEMLGENIFCKLSEKGAGMINMALGGCSQMITLIKDLLEAEKINSGTVQLTLKEEDLSATIGQAIGLVRQLADQKKITILAPQASFKLYIDRDRVVQVIVNLLSNAVKFSPEDATIKVGCRRDNGFIVIEVRDQGRGIPADRLATIFDRFTQVSSRDSTQHGGTGLGLSIVKTLVELHGGSVSVESAVDQGTTFIVRLPDPLKSRPGRHPS